MVGTGICPICHRDELPHHVPTQCLMLAQFGLTFLTCPPVNNAPAPAPSPAPAATQTGHAAAADGSSASGSSGSSSAPSGLTAALALVVPPIEDFDSDEEYHWEGDEYRTEYAPPSKVNTQVALYSPSCSQVTLVASNSSLSMFLSHSTATLSPLSLALIHRLDKMTLSPVDIPLPHGCFVVTDTRATDHMVPNKLCFISYKSVSGLSLCMGNNSFDLVLGHGTAAFSLNGKQILVRHVLHVPRLAVPLYSLHTQVIQCGCGFLSTGESGFLCYFSSFVLTVDIAVNCHLSFEPLGHSALLHTLHYVQPRCPPAQYPSKISPAVSHATSSGGR
jgi:hypothetical protein